MIKSTQRMIICFLCLWGIAISAAPAWADEASTTHTIMHPDRETRLRWIRDYEEAPRVDIDEAKKLLLSLRASSSLSLLSHLDYIPSERNQGNCGNCWAWAGTGVMAIALDVQDNVRDRLSVQYLNSCKYDSTSACCGGWLSDLVDFYTSSGQAIPWSNSNAGWQDGDKDYCVEVNPTSVSCESVSTSVRYPVGFIAVETIETQGISKEDAIANIKAVLNQSKAVWFSFFMSTEDDWNNFYDFWNNQSEDVLWDFDSTCGKVWDDDHGGGHAVLCVGYNDIEPANSYWIMLNTWGKTDDRPNGLFRVDMDMNYSCMFTEAGEDYYSVFLQTLDIDFGTVSSATTGAAAAVASGSATLNGTVNPNMESTTCYFEYGKTTGYGSTTTSRDTGSGTDDVSVNADIDGLTANTTYHYRLRSENSFGVTYGGDTTFDTPAPPPATTSSGGSGCFIATAAYGSPMHPHIEVLRKFRDRYLLATTPGKGLVAFYYNSSPPLSDFIAKHNFLKVMVRCSLLPVVGFCYASLHVGMTAAAIILYLVFLLSVIFLRAFLKPRYSRQ